MGGRRRALEVAVNTFSFSFFLFIFFLLCFACFGRASSEIGIGGLESPLMSWPTRGRVLGLLFAV